MDKDTIKMLTGNIFRKVSNEMLRSDMTDNYYLEHPNELKDKVMNTLSNLHIEYSSDDVELINQGILETMSVWTQEEEEDSLFEMDIFLGDLDGIMRDSEDLFVNWSGILARKDIKEHKESLLEDFNKLLTLIYERREELEAV